MSSKSESRRQSLIIIILVMLLLVTNIFNGFAFFSDSKTVTSSSSVLVFGTVGITGSIYDVGTNQSNVGQRSPVNISFASAEALLPGDTVLYTLKLDSLSAISTCLRVKVVFELQLAANGSQYSEYTFQDVDGNTQNFIDIEMVKYNKETEKYESIVQDGQTGATDTTKWSKPATSSQWIYYNSTLLATSGSSAQVSYFDFRLKVNEKFGSRATVNSDSQSEVADLINRNYRVKVYVSTIQAVVGNGSFGWDTNLLPANWLNLLGLSND